MKYFLFIIILFLCTKNLPAQDINIIPKPVSVKADSGFFKINKQIVVSYSQNGIEKSAAFFNEYLQQFYGFQLTDSKSNVSNNGSISLSFEHQNNLPKGYYKLTVSNNKIIIKADDEKGVFYAIQTLIQLLPTSVSTNLTFLASP